MDIVEGSKFIKLVQKCPILYNKRSGGYKRTDLKLKRWQEIAKQMKYNDAITAQKKWKYLRDKYVKIKREEKNITSSAETDECLGEWPLQIHLQFLDEFIQPRGRYLNMKYNNSEPESSIISQEEVADIENQHYIKSEVEEEYSDMDPSIEPSRSSTSPTQSDTLDAYNSSTPGHVTTRSIRGNAGIPRPDRVDTSQANICSCFTNKASGDSDYAFAQYVATELKAMSPSRKRRFKRLVVDFILEEEN